MQHVVCIQFIKFAYTDYGSSTSWQIVDVSEDILRIKQEIDVELHGEDQSWVRNDSAVSPLITFSLGLFFYLLIFSDVHKVLFC